MTLMPVTRISAEVVWSANDGRLAVDLARVVCGDRAGLVHRLADDVHDPAERGRADRHGDRAAGVDHRLAAGQALGGVHGDGAHGVLAQVLGDFQDQAEGLAGALVGVGGLQGAEDRRQVAVELDVDDGADDLDDRGRWRRPRRGWTGLRLCRPWFSSAGRRCCSRPSGSTA